MELFIAIVVTGLAGFAGIGLALLWEKYVIHKGWRGWHIDD